MKKMILSVCVLSLALITKAQQIPERKTDKPEMMQGHKGHHGHDGMNMKELNLTDEQKQQFKTNREEFRKKMEDLKKNDNITVKEWKSKMESLRQEQKTKMQSILTADQKAKMEKMKADRQAKGEEKRKQRAGEMKTRLGLTDEQSAKLEKSHKDMGDQLRAIRENKSLSDDQKREQMKALHDKQKETMKSILTPDQMKKLKESHHQGPHGKHGTAPKEDQKQTI